MRASINLTLASVLVLGASGQSLVAAGQEVPTVQAEPAHALVGAGAARPALAHIRPGDRLYIQPSEFGLALSAAILKKDVPVTVTTDSTKADFYVITASQSSKEGGAERVAKVLAFGFGAGSGKHFDGTATFMNTDGDVVFAYNSRKENFQSAAQNLAKNLRKRIEEWRDSDLRDPGKH